MNFYIFRIKAVKFHIKFYTYACSIKYILCTFPSSKPINHSNKKVNGTLIKTINFISFLMYEHHIKKSYLFFSYYLFFLFLPIKMKFKILILQLFRFSLLLYLNSSLLTFTFYLISNFCILQKIFLETEIFCILS